MKTVFFNIALIITFIGQAQTRLNNILKLDTLTKSGAIILTPKDIKIVFFNDTSNIIEKINFRKLKKLSIFLEPLTLVISKNIPCRKYIHYYKKIGIPITYIFRNKKYEVITFSQRIYYVKWLDNNKIKEAYTLDFCEEPVIIR